MSVVQWADIWKRLKALEDDHAELKRRIYVLENPPAVEKRGPGRPRSVVNV